jgi:L,D-transpeptidase YbiS
MNKIIIDITQQLLSLYVDGKLLKSYSISTAAKGIGQLNGSEQTPLGKHIIRAKIGANRPINTVFVKRRPTGEIYTPQLREQFPERDWILTRILWLSGLEIGKNRLGNVDTMRRYIYIHGSPDDVQMGSPGSRGCIRMRNQDIVELYNKVMPGDSVNIKLWHRDSLS